MQKARSFLENEVFHAGIRKLLSRLAEQDHQYDPFDLLDIDIGRFKRQQPVHEDLALRWRQDADLLKISDVAAATCIEPFVFELVIYAGAVLLFAPPFSPWKDKAIAPS